MKYVKWVFCCICVLALMLSGCDGTGKRGTDYNLYFANAEKNNLAVEVRNLEIRNQEDVAETLMKELIDGPTGAGLRAVIPEGTKVRSVMVKDGLASVNLSQKYYGAEPAVELLARYSIVNTLCDVEGIQSVKIFVEGLELMNANSIPVGALSKEDIILDPRTATTEKQLSVTLYFSDESAQALVGEHRSVAMVDNSAEKTILLELIKGPNSAALIKTIPAETKVLSVETQQGICFVNLSADFVSRHSGGGTAEQLTVYSIVNSLTELETVDRVQFLIEGKKAEVYKHMVFDQPFERKNELLK